MKRLLLLLICLLLIVPIVSADYGGSYLTFNIAPGSYVYAGDVIEVTSHNPDSGKTKIGGIAPWTYPSGGAIATEDLGTGHVVTYTVKNVAIQPQTVIYWLPDDIHRDSYLWPNVQNGSPRPPPPVASFTADVVSGEAPLTVTFTDTSTGTPTSWYWAVSSGSYTRSDTVQNPTFTLSDPGIYTVALTATNEVGNDTETKMDYITVGSYNPVVFRVYDIYTFAGIQGATVYTSDGQTGTTDVNGHLALNIWGGSNNAYASKAAYWSPGVTTFDSSTTSTVNLFLESVGATPTPTTPVPVVTTIPATPPTPVPTAEPTATPTPNPVTSPSASFTASNTTGSMPRHVTLTSTSTNSPTNFVWGYWAPGSDTFVQLDSTTSTASFDTAVEGLYSGLLWCSNEGGYDSVIMPFTVVITTIPTATPTITPTPQPTATPDPVFGGGNISWDKSLYANGETATITYSIDAPIFAATGYTFRVITKNNYGAIVETIPVTTQYGTEEITTSSTSYPAGTYHALIQSVTPAGVTTTLASDSMSVQTQVLLTGYVHDADTTLPINGTTISVTQLGVNAISTSDTNGYWSSANWSAGYVMTLAAGKTGYQSQTLSFTPGLTQEYSGVNWSLMNQTVTNPNTTIRGVVRSRIVPNRPIVGASVIYANSSMLIITSTNSVGMYRFDGLKFGDSGTVHSSMAGFYNSSITPVTAGV